MKVARRLQEIAALVLDQGQPKLFKRLVYASMRISDHDTGLELLRGIQEDEEEDLPEEEEDDDEDVEGNFAGFPVGALPYKERRRGPHPKDVAIGKPQWWEPH